MFTVQVHRSALKRGLTPDTIIQMWHCGVHEMIIDDNEPPRYIRLAFDSAGMPWEIAALSFGNGSRYLIIHAMPARKSVILKIQRGS